MSLNAHRIQYEVVRSDRSRRVRLQVEPDGLVRVILPPGVPPAAAREILNSASDWVLRVLANIERAAASLPASGTLLPYRGTEVRLEVSPGTPGRCLVRLVGTRLIARAAPGDIALLAGLEGWYRAQARALLTERAQHWQRRMNVTYERLTVRDQSTRWGSCSARGNLNFNWRLVMAPLAVLDYVVIHELMHRREPNHGPAFWRGVELHCPEYQCHKRWLEEHGPRLAAVLR